MQEDKGGCKGGKTCCGAVGMKGGVDTEERRDGWKEVSDVDRPIIPPSSSAASKRQRSNSNHFSAGQKFQLVECFKWKLLPDFSELSDLLLRVQLRLQHWTSGLSTQSPLVTHIYRKSTLLLIYPSVLYKLVCSLFDMKSMSYREVIDVSRSSLSISIIFPYLSACVISRFWIIFQIKSSSVIDKNVMYRSIKSFIFKEDGRSVNTCMFTWDINLCWFI